MDAQNLPDAAGRGRHRRDAPAVQAGAPAAARCRRSIRARWQNFKANRRGYWSLWIFLGPVRGVAVRRIHRQRQAVLRALRRQVRISRRWSTIRKPRSAAISRPRPTIAIRICRNSSPTRAATCCGRRSATPTIPIISICRRRRRRKPTWLLTEAQCREVVEQKHLKSCSDLEYNWLGTDDQGRDVVARLIYGFRISVLFGLMLTIVSSVVGIAAGAVQGYFGGWTDLLFQRFIEVWTSMPRALSAADHLLGAGARLLRAARHPAAVLLGVAGRAGARRIPARPQFRIHPGRARARRVQRRHHVPPPAAERHGGDHDVPAVHHVVAR